MIAVATWVSAAGASMDSNIRGSHDCSSCAVVQERHDPRDHSSDCSLREVVQGPYGSSWQREQGPHKLGGHKEDCGGDPHIFAHFGNVGCRVSPCGCDA